MAIHRFALLVGLVLATATGAHADVFGSAENCARWFDTGDAGFAGDAGRDTPIFYFDTEMFWGGSWACGYDNPCFSNDTDESWANPFEITAIDDDSVTILNTSTGIETVLPAC